MKIKGILAFLFSLVLIIGIGIFNASSVYAANIGDELIEKEDDSWTRYKCDNENITYVGDGWHYGKVWDDIYHSNYGSSNTKLKFNFKGTKLRIIDGYWTTNSKDVDVIIDGKNEGKYITNNGEDNKNQNLLIYEKTGLSNGEHSVELINNTTEYLTIHYIDVDGKLMPYNEILYTQILNIEPEKEIINLNDNVTANITIDNIKEIAAEDIRIKYDSSKLQFLGSDQVDGIKVVKDEESDGELRVILASQGKDNIANTKKTLLKLNFKGIAIGEALVDITKGRISDGITMERDLADEECGQATIIIEDYKDPNKDGEFTLLDLAIDGRHYGENPADLPEYKTDIVENGAIDDEDLIQIGKYMLENPNYTF